MAIRYTRKQGFTLIELLLILGLFALLLSFTTVNLTPIVGKASLDTTVSMLVSDLKEQQLKAMIGESEGSGSAQAFGIHFEPDHYVLFRSSVFNPAEPSNFTVNLEQGLELESALPEVVFQKGNGEIASLLSLTARNTTVGQTKVITVSQYGVVTVQ